MCLHNCISYVLYCIVPLYYIIVLSLYRCIVSSYRIVVSLYRIVVSYRCIVEMEILCVVAVENTIPGTECICDKSFLCK
jgi:hypothetical protein